MDGVSRVLLVLHEVVDAGGAGAQHLEHHHGVCNDSRGARTWRANDKCIWVAYRTGHLDLEIAGIYVTRVAPQPCADRYADIPLDRRVAARAAGHRGRGETIELPAQFLPFFPGQERLHRHRAADGNAHAAAYHGAAVKSHVWATGFDPAAPFARHQRLPESGHSADLSGSDRSHEALTLGKVEDGRGAA